MKVVSRSTTLVTIFYLFMGFFGYISTLGKTTDIVLIRDPLPSYTVDYFMLIAMLAVLVIMVVNCVVNFIPFKNNVFYMIYEHDDMSKK